MAVRVPSGPISRNRLTPDPPARRPPSANRTACRTCRTQYPPSTTPRRRPAHRSRARPPAMGAANDTLSSNRPELGEHRLHQRRMERMATRNRFVLRPDSANCAATSNTASAAPDDHHRPRTVNRRDTPARPTLQQRHHLVLGRLDRHHRATRAATPASAGPAPPPPDTRPPTTTHPPHAPPPTHRSNDPATIIRPHPPRLHQPEQRHLDREQGRLGEARLVQQLGVRTEHHLPQRTIQRTVDVRTHLVKRLGEHRERRRTAPGPCPPAAHPAP